MQSQLARLETAFNDAGFPCVLSLTSWQDVWQKIDAVEGAEECFRFLCRPRELVESPLVRARNGASIVVYRISFCVVAATPELAESKARAWASAIFRAKGGRLGRPLSTPFSFEGVRIISVRPSGDSWDMSSEPAPIVGNAGNYWSSANDFEIAFLEE